MIVRRVAYVVNTFPRISETFIAGELAELGRRGIDFRVLSLNVPPEEPRHDVVMRARLFDRTVYDTGQFSTVLRELAPQLVHAHFATEPAAMAQALAADLQVPFTFTAHGYDIYRRPPADLPDRARAAAAVVTVSAANARHLVGALGIPASHVRVIACGVDTARFRPNGAPDPATIVCVARLKPVKNLGILLQACAHLRDRGTRFRCVIVGDGPSRDELLAARTSLGLDEVVTFVGAATQGDVLAWWQRARCAVLTSSSEGMPVCLMEAASCGVPGVATAVGGVPELIENGITGLLVPSGDSQAAAAALERLLCDRALAARLGAAARKRAEQQFSVVRQVDRLLELWADLLGNGTPQ